MTTSAPLGRPVTADGVAVRPSARDQLESLDDLVSVIIACHKQGRFLGEAIASVLSQSYERKEVVVVDDGSTDETAAVAAQYPVRYVTQSRAGPSAARNRGLRESSGAYVVFLDADDRLLPDALATGVACLQTHPECAFVFGDYRHIAEDGSFLRPAPEPAREPDPYSALLHHNHIGMLGAVVFRRDVFDVAGAFDEQLAAAVDYDLYLRIARRFPVRQHPQMVAEYRKHGSSLSDDPALMLRCISRVQRRERRHLHDRSARDALKAGIRDNRAYYLQRHLEKLGEDLSASRSSRRLRVATASLRYEPGWFLKVLAPGPWSLFRRFSTATRNLLIRLSAPSDGSTGRLIAIPNPVRTAPWCSIGATTLWWQTSGARRVEIRKAGPAGFVLSSGPKGTMRREWVPDGMRFYLQDVSGDRPDGVGRTLAVVTIDVIPER